MGENSSLPLLYHTHHTLMSDDLPFWLAWAHQQGAPILELGCGTGRILVPLAEAGYSVFGIDNAADRLDFLRKRLAPELRSKVVLIGADFRHICLTSRFPLIIMPCNTFSTLDAQAQVQALARLRLHLAHDGVFVVSMPNPMLLKDLPPEGAEEIETAFDHPQSGHLVQVVSQWERKLEKVTFYWHYDHILPDDKIDRQTLSAQHYIQEVSQIVQHFKETGFTIVEMYGDYDCEPFDPDAPYLILVAKTHTKN